MNFIFFVALVSVNIAWAAPVAVRQTEGLLHGFLVVQTLQGQTLADGELTQVAAKGHVTGRTIFRFRDGSLYDDTVVYSQQGTFRLLTDHLIERGPSFPRATDTMLNTSTGQVTVRYKEKDGQDKILNEKLDLPLDIANGFATTLLKNIQPTVAESKLSMLVATPKPRVVALEVRPAGEDPFSVGHTQKTATHYVVKVKIGGVAGVVAPIIGKQPPETHVWILEGEAPAFVKSEGPMFEDGPIWRIQSAAPPLFKDALDNNRSPSVKNQAKPK